MPSHFSKGGLDGGIFKQELHMCLQMLKLKLHYQNKPLLLFPVLFSLIFVLMVDHLPLSSKGSPLYHRRHHTLLILEIKINFCEHSH